MTEHVRTKIEGLSRERDRITIKWCDGGVSHFHFIWLRHQCECEECGSSLNAVRGLRLDLIPERPNPREQSFDPDRLRVIWEEDGHVSTYEAKWLRDHCYSAEERARRKHRPVLWDKRIEANPPTFNFSEVEDSASSRLQMLETVCDYGFCKVEGAPGLAQEAGRLIQMVGAKRITHFGDFELSNKNCTLLLSYYNLRNLILFVFFHVDPRAHTYTPSAKRGFEKNHPKFVPGPLLHRNIT